MKLARYIPSSKPPDNPFDEDLDRSLDRVFSIIREILNGGLIFEDNFRCFKTTITTSATPGEETAIEHGLKQVPVGFIVLEKDKPAHVYLGATTKDRTYFYVRSDVESVKVTLLIIGGVYEDPTTSP